MTTVLDLEPPARSVARLLDRITDDQLSGPTPCPDYSVRDLLGHLVHLTAAFRDAGTKTRSAATGTDPGSVPPPGLDGDWRTRLREQLDELVTAWRNPGAWEGMTEAGGFTFPASEAGKVALNELLIHGWDLARATGQEYSCDDATARASIDLMAPTDPEASDGMFGPAVAVPEDAPPLDRAVGLSGRDPSWSPHAASRPSSPR
ncbi:TIGR03086 family metal-binding protein [Streptomyces sp. NPDC047108]|uniref:TIGR03086 family metal-binding protein n=1 Tax=Streptomyces sp. NPDC047108 TaxID=3155025 RepID=UPI0033DBA4FF